MKKSPYAILLGGKHRDALLELHDLRFTLAHSWEDAFQNVSNAWFGDLNSAHVDAWIDLSFTDGHQACTVEEAEKGKTLFFVNVGSYKKGIFNEHHQYHFLIASSLAEVKKRALNLISKTELLVHIDNAEKIDAIIEVGQIDSQKIYWKKGSRNPPQIHTGYWPIKKYRKT